MEFDFHNGILRATTLKIAIAGSERGFAAAAGGACHPQARQPRSGTVPIY
jgi:hypothetical protein